ncbi:hypothetical protein BT63DRAFT_427812 [Microthyrium microscopicum]|uniref:Leucine-rich repeat domain-containing protein n=1 Tax=Microthyrium microscopicum TaxID=703497 RepID=A0A6A6U138_9PEZI|nr:hypothetical protein BT63DRAFT_427812 [Microthyrium microscopicum]
MADTISLWDASSSADFLRSLIERRSLADTILSITDQSWSLDQSELEPDGLEAIVEAAKSLDLPEKETWIKALENGTTDAILALILYLTPNLQELSLVIPYMEEKTKSLVWKLFNVAGQAGSSSEFHNFSSLEIIKGQHWDTEDGFDMGVLAVCFRLPSLRKVEAFACSSENEIDEGDWPEKFSEVDTLSFEFSDMDESSIGAIVASCKALKSFSCQWGPATVGASEFTIPGIADALRSQKHSLEQLTLDAREAFAIETAEEEFEAIGSLKDFEKLASLTLSSVFLSGSDDNEDYDPPELTDILPSTLKDLKILGRAERLLDQVKAFAQVCEADIPTLDVLILENWSDNAEEQQQLLDDFSRAGVKCSVK